MSALKVTTMLGSFTIALYEERAPVTCGYFKSIFKQARRSEFLPDPIHTKSVAVVEPNQETRR